MRDFKDVLKLFVTVVGVLIVVFAVSVALQLVMATYGVIYFILAFLIVVFVMCYIGVRALNW